jgi:peroxiredoxin
MKKVGFFLTVILIVLSACNNKEKFHVQGTVTNADNKVLYFEAEGLDSVSILDSVKLDNKGNFSFKGNRPECPEFYRLRLGNNVIHFSVDSTETIDIAANATNFTAGYSIKGSESCQKIKELTLKQIQLQETVNKLQNKVKSGSFDGALANDSVNHMIDKYKKDVMINYIFKGPNKPYAYFALFQNINGYLLFDSNNKKDIKCFQAVATSLNTFYPKSLRSRNLYNVTIKGLQTTYSGPRKMINIPQNKVSSAGLINISLPDMDGNVHKLTDLKGKVVILDYVMLSAKGAAQHNFKLRGIYNKYKKSGLEIYQIALDADEHYWKTAADNLPWICVRDENGEQSTNVTLYNVTSVPTMFIINRSNEVKERITDVNKLDTAIKAVL